MPRIELFGPARLLAGRRYADVPGHTARQMLRQLAAACPELVGQVLQADGRPTPAYTLNINGTRFTTNVDEPLIEGDELLLLSSLSGG